MLLQNVRNIPLSRALCKRLQFVARCLYSTNQKPRVSGGGQVDRTKLEGDIYDDTPELEAQKQYEEMKHKEEQEEAEMKERLLNAALRFVPKYGWSKKAIIEGATAEGLPPLTHGLVSKGAIELVHHFYDSANRELANKLANEVKEVELGHIEKKRLTVFVKDAITFRLYLLAPYLDTWPQAMALMALPQNVLESLKRLSYLCDDVWYYAGDRSVDFNWYTKRLTLAGAYNSTELYMMQDKSANFGDTWAFLGRRLEDLHSIGKGVKQVQETSGALGNLILGSCIMARNTLGINDRFR